MIWACKSKSLSSKKIAVVGTRGFPGVQGGVETHCENLYPLLVNSGYNITVFTRRPYVNPELTVYRGVRLIPIGCPRNKYLETIVHTFLSVLAARRMGVDLIHFHAIGPALFVPLARLFGMKSVVRHVGRDYDRAKWGLLARTALKLGEYCSSKADTVICISTDIEEKLSEGYKPCRLCMIPNGVPQPCFLESQKVLDQHGLEQGKFILAVGRLVPEKGLDVLVDAFERLERPPGWKLAIAGTDPYASHYSRKLNERIHTLYGVVAMGELDRLELAELYSHASVFCLPSSHEGLSFSLLEALSYGLPCVVSDIPANKTVPLSERCYFHAKNRNDLVQQLTSQIYLQQHPEHRRKLSTRTIAKYNWQVVASQTEEVYETIFARNAASLDKQRY